MSLTCVPILFLKIVSCIFCEIGITHKMITNKNIYFYNIRRIVYDILFTLTSNKIKKQ